MQSLKVTAMLRYLTLAFTILPVLIVGTVGYFTMSGFSSNVIKRYSVAIGSSQSQAINQCISSYANDVVFIALSTEVNTYTTVSQTDAASDEKMKKQLIAATNRDSTVLNAVLIHLDGSVWVEAEEKQTNKELFYAFDDAVGNMASDQLYISPIFPANDYYDTDTFCIIKKVQELGVQDGNGFIASVISTERIKSILANTSYGNGGYLAVTDGSGTVLNFEGNASEKLDALNDGALIDIMKTTGSSTEAVEYTAGGYTGTYGFFSGFSGSGWKWLSIYPAGEAASRILVPTLISLGVMAALAAVCVVIGVAVRKSIVNPVRAMINSMNEIKEGDYEKRMEIDTSNEFKEMTALFNGMLDDVCMSEELHRTISDLSDNMLFEWDFHKEIMYLSNNFKDKFDIDPKQAQLANGKFLDSLMSEDFATIYKRDISSLLKNKSGHSGEYQMTTKNGVLTWFSVRATCVTDRVGEPLRVIGVVTDIDNEKKMALQLSERASYDFLSQLYNRSTFERELQSEIKRNAQARVAVVFIDVDDFKFINDRFGHSVGDEVIKYVSGCIKNRVKGTGFAGRFGGDEFVLCVTDPKQIEEIETLSLDLIDELYSGYYSDLANVSINVKASIGIAYSPEHGDNGAQLVAAADEAMYFVKKNGKANYHIYTPEDSQIEDLQHTL